MNLFIKTGLLFVCIGCSHIGYAALTELARINVELFGEVTTSTCGVLESEQHKYIDLGVHSIKSLNGVGTKTKPVPIPFTLSNCHPNSPITLTFSGTQDVSNPEFLALESLPNMAKNVAIELLDYDKKRLPLNTKSQTLTADQDGRIVTNFYANYIVTRDSVTPGVANANAQFTIQYD